MWWRSHIVNIPTAEWYFAVLSYLFDRSWRNVTSRKKRCIRDTFTIDDDYFRLSQWTQTFKNLHYNQTFTTFVSSRESMILATKNAYIWHQRWNCNEIHILGFLPMYLPMSTRNRHFSEIAVQPLLFLIICALLDTSDQILSKPSSEECFRKCLARSQSSITKVRLNFCFVNLTGVRPYTTPTSFRLRSLKWIPCSWGNFDAAQW